MKTRFMSALSPSTLLRTSLLAVLLAACASQALTAQPAPVEPTPTLTQPIIPELTEPSATPSPSPDVTATYTLELLFATPPVDSMPVATSRGPNLEATDPATVTLASGQLQFVEFFRFT